MADAYALTENAARKIAELWRKDYRRRQAGTDDFGNVPTKDSRHHWLAKSTQQILKGNTGTVQIYSGDTAGGETATEHDAMNAYARYGDVEDDSWVFVHRVSGHWEVIQFECDDNPISSLTTSISGGSGDASSYSVAAYNSTDAQTYSVQGNDLMASIGDRVATANDEIAIAHGDIVVY